MEVFTLDQFHPVFRAKWVMDPFAMKFYVQGLILCSHLTFASTSPSKFSIVSMETQTKTHRMGLNPFLTFYIHTMLNLMVTQTQTQTSSVNIALTLPHNVSCLPAAATIQSETFNKLGYNWQLAVPNKFLCFKIIEGNSLGITRRTRVPIYHDQLFLRLKYFN